MGKRQRIKDFFKFPGGGSTSSRLAAGSANASLNLIEGHSSLPHLPVNEDIASLPSTEPHVTTNTAQVVSIAAPTRLTEPDAVSSIYHVTPHVKLVPQPKEPQPIIISAEPLALELSTSQRLWNAAYDSLEKEDDTAKLAKSYIKTLTRILTDAASNTSAFGDDTLASLDDPTKRQEYMKKLVEEGRKKVATLSKIVGTVGDIAEFIISAKGMVDAAIQSIPQAALPWAGVCIGLQILLNPSKAKKANLAGIAYVTSRMDWYCALTEHLLSKEHITIGNESYTTVIKRLEQAIIELYKALISYQMTSVCSYYSNQSIVYFRDTLNLDDWDGSLKSVKDAEAIVENMSAQYYREYEKSSLHHLVNSGRKMEMYLGDIHQDLRDFMAKQKQAGMDDKHRKCLRDLFVVDPQYEMESIENKKDKLLDNAFRWILNTKQFAAFTNWTDNEPGLPPCRLLWIKGPAGTGKTMLLIGIIRELMNHSATLAPNVYHFFCQATDSNRNSATAVLKSLVWLLAVQQPCLIHHLYKEYEFSGASLFNDANTYVTLCNVLKSMLGDCKFKRAYLIVDALDECTHGLADLVNLISTSLSISDKVKWLVASRPEVKLNSPTVSGALVELDAQSLEDPVNAYIDHKLSNLRSRTGYSEAILDEISRDIRDRAANIFLWAALVFKGLDMDGVYGWNAVKIIREMPPGLSELYDHLMARIEKLSNEEYCRNVLMATSLAYRPLSLLELSVLAGLPAEVEQQIIVQECGSFLTIREEIVYLIHQSAKDYLEKRFSFQQGGDTQGHVDMYKRSIKAMSNLKQNIYGLTDFGFKPKNIQPPTPDPLAPLQYSCLFWVDHLCDASNPKNELADDEGVWLFLKDHVLHWLESLSLLGRLPDSVRSIRRILQQLQSNMNLRLTTFLNDIERFILSNGSIIDRAPLQAYGSALVFSPGLSEVNKQQWKERLVFIKYIHGLKERDAYLQTLEGHSDAVQAIAFSPDSKTLASGSLDHTVRLWDAITGSLKQTIEGHTGGVNAIAFSPDGKTLASGSLDHTVRLWDAKTGSLQQTLEGHYNEVKAIVFSPDGQTLASGSLDRTVRLWDAITGSLQQILPVYGHWVRAIAFSPDSKTLASALMETLKLWDTTTGSLQQTLEGHDDEIQAITFSPDNKTLASGSVDKTVWLWDVTTGSHQQTLEGHIDTVRAIAFSPDGKTLASTSRETVWLWDVTTGSHQQTLEGHSDRVKAITFSPDGKSLASASDKMVRLWDTTITSPQQTLKGHSNEIQAIALSPDGKTLASTSYHTLDLWDTTTGLLKQTIDKPGQQVEVIRFSPDGKMIATASFMTLGVWDVETRSLQLKLWAQGQWVRGITFSPDSKTLASASNKAVELWDTAIGSLQQKLKGFNHGAEGVAFSADGKTLALVIDWKTIWLRDITTGSIQQRIEGHSERIRALAFSPDGKMIASASDDKTIRLWNTATGLLQQTLQNYSHGDQVMTFSADGEILNTSHGSMRIHDNSNIQTSNCGAKNALLITDEWITYNGKELLWLPAEYRDSLIAVYGYMVAIGLRLGGVIFLHLKL